MNKATFILSQSSLVLLILPSITAILVFIPFSSLSVASLLHIDDCSGLSHVVHLSNATVNQNLHTFISFHDVVWNGLLLCNHSLQPVTHTLSRKKCRLIINIRCTGAECFDSFNLGYSFFLYKRMLLVSLFVVTY